MQGQKPNYIPPLLEGPGPLEGTLRQRLFRITLPLIFNQGSVIFMLFCDRMFLSWYGTNEISAVWPATFLYISCMTLFYAVSGFVNVFVAQYYGAGNKKMCSAMIWQGIYYSFSAYLILLCLIPLGRQVFGLFGHRPEIASLERTFYTLLMCAAVMPILNTVFAAFFTGRGLTHITMTANILGNVVNIGLDWVLIFGHCGAPRLGILGAGLATAIASTVAPAYMFALFLRQRYQLEYETRKQWKFRPKLIKKMLRMGLSSGVHDLTYSSAVALFFMFMGRALPESLAANNIAWSINDLLTLYIHGVTLANTTLLAQAIGADRQDEAERLCYFVLKCLLFPAALVGVFYLFFPDTLLQVFHPRLDGPERLPFDTILPRGRKVLLFFIGYDFLFPIIYIFRQALRGAGDTRYFLKVSLFVDVLYFLPGIFLAVRFFGVDYVVLWSFFLSYLLILSVVFTRRFRGGRWKHCDREHLQEQA